MSSAPITTGDRGSLSSRDLARLLAGAAGAPAWQWFGGHAFGVVGDLEPLRQLFEVEGCTVTVARTGTDGSLQIAARQVTLYRDPVSRAVIERWRNPYTQQDIPVQHQHLPVIGATLASNAPGTPWFGTGAHAAVFLETHAASHFPLQPAAAPAQASRRATSSVQLTARRTELRDPAAPIAYVGAWQLLTDWPEWLDMGAQPGYLFQRTFVRKARNRDDLPQALRRAIRDRFADGLEPAAVAA